MLLRALTLLFLATAIFLGGAFAGRHFDAELLRRNSMPSRALAKLEDTTTPWRGKAKPPAKWWWPTG
jgi:hypothetical protein